MVNPMVLSLLRQDSLSSTVSFLSSTVDNSDAYSFVDGDDDSSMSALSLPLEKSLRYKLLHYSNDDGSVYDDHYQQSRAFPWIVGHRGCLYQQLENTREGFQECARMGCDAVELDVFVLKCGTVIVFHGDGTDDYPGLLQNYCNVDGSILDYTYQEAVAKLKFNPTYQEFGCPPEVTLRGKIPTLEEVLLDAKQSGIHVKIELKGDGTVKPTLDLVERLQMTSQCSYSSFDLNRLKELREMRHDRLQYPTGALFGDLPTDYLERARNCGATEIHLKYDTCTKDRIREIHAAGFGSMLWMRGPIGMAADCSDLYWDVGNEDKSMYLALVETGVQQMCINRPDVLLELRRQHREQQGPQDTMAILKNDFFEPLNSRNETIISTKAS